MFNMLLNGLFNIFVLSFIKNVIVFLVFVLVLVRIFLFENK